MEYVSHRTNPESLDTLLNERAAEGYVLDNLCHIPGGIRTIILAVFRTVDV